MADRRRRRAHHAGAGGMTWAWTDWAPRGSTTPPYRDFWELINRPLPGTQAPAFWAPDCTGQGTPDHPAEVLRTLGTEMAGFPLPQDAQNPGFARQDSWLPPEDALPTVDDDTVIVGVIDTGIALGQDRFRSPAGSRVLAAWQMNRPHTAAQGWLPFGHELYKADIDAALARHSRRGSLDQYAFDTEMGLLDLARPTGSRELAGTFAHGTHVADLAGGFDPVDRRAAKIALIVVTLPPPSVFGASGTFLDGFMLMAILRIRHLAHAIRAKSTGSDRGTRDRLDNPGYPLAINLSFGRQAGAKDGSGAFAQALARIEAQSPAGAAPARVVMPAGNDNQLRVNARMPVTPRGQTLTWQIPPGDHSANYAEVWTEPGVTLTLTPPGGAAPITGAPAAGMSATLTQNTQPVARLYAEQHGTRLRLLLCLAPSLQNTPARPQAPAGAWDVTLSSPEGTRFDATLSVQTDQALVPGSRRGPRSHFQDPAYHRFDAQGRARDVGNESPGAMVTRFGTVNASASSPDVLCIGGYRGRDGRPAGYSAAGGDQAAPHVTAAAPSDDSTALFGVLAAGAQNGSKVAARGTSFACAQATRQVALGWLSELATGTALSTAEALMSAAVQGYTGPTEGSHPAKLGQGRFARADAPELAR